MGYVVDLTNEWQSFEAAKKAIENTVSVRSVKAFGEKQKALAKKIISKLDDEVLPKGVLTNEYVLQKMDKLLDVQRDANTACKWLMLHRLSHREELRLAVLESAKTEVVLELLLYTAQYELLLKKNLEVLINEREKYWGIDKDAARDNMADISEYFSEKSNFKKRKANTEYSEYFSQMQRKIEELAPEKEAGSVSRKIQKYIKALEDIAKYDQIENNIQVRDHIEDTQRRLKGMLKVLNLRMRLRSDFKRVADCSYSFLILKDYKANMQKTIRKNAASTLLLRATFMKLSSIMDRPMIRIIQLDALYTQDQLDAAPHASNFRSVSNYYSSELMKFVRDVLQVVPRRVFELAGSSLLDVLTPKIKSMPGEIDQNELREYALFEKRAK